MCHQQAIDGIWHDSAELVRGALRHKYSNPEERLEASGPAGAPFSFANAVGVARIGAVWATILFSVCTRLVLPRVLLRFVYTVLVCHQGAFRQGMLMGARR